MCGITGSLGGSHGRPLDETIARMTEPLRHRGPDDAGHWTDPEAGIALGHRRLSILDRSQAGHQPMVSATGRFVLVFNGEIYNHLELRRELDSMPSGQPLRQGGEGPSGWRGYSDTETLLAAFERWGVVETLRRTLGMFALGLWDRAERRLYLARDRLGEKPLYYGWCDGSFLFASELKALRAYPGFGNPVDRSVLATYLRFVYVPEPWSIYSGIYKLEPGCVLTLSIRGADSRPSEAPRAPTALQGVSVQRWWSLRDAAQEGQADLLRDEREACEALEGRLREAVRLQSIADVPLGAFLSGGVDSSTVVALMQSESISPVRTFTVGFEDAALDETAHARAVARHLGTDHTELHVTASEALGAIPGLPGIYDEPFADSSQIPTVLVCGQARRHVTVALSGDAGDELFGGYNRYFWARRIWGKLGWLPVSAREALGRWMLAPPTERWDRLAAGLGLRLSLAGDKVRKLGEGLAARDLDELYRYLVSEWKRPGTVALGAEEAPTLLARPQDWPTLTEAEHRMMALDAMTYLPGDILCKVDRAAMAVSLETRAPFLDHRVVELAWRMPLGMKIRGEVGKWPLRQILYKYVPRELIERPKQGFAIPLAEWLRGPLRDWAETLLDERRLAGEGFFDPAPIRQRWREHLDGRRDWQQALWAVLMFQAWREAQV